MRIYTLWHEGQGGDLPWLVGAVDEYTVDENGGFPTAYAELRERVYHRELIIDVPQKAVSALFESPEVEAKAIKE
jgi:hypothetical protein